jgi:chromatin remodeling complex protein RSC6
LEWLQWQPVQEAAPAVVEAHADTPAAPVATEATPTENSWETLDAQFKNILSDLQEWRNTLSTVQSNVRKLQKNVQRSLKENARKNRRRGGAKSDRPPRAPSGFAKPALISDALCSFLGCESGTEMARTEVTKHLTQYIKNQGLQDQANKRRIRVDQKLGQLLGVTSEDEVTYFNLQKYMKVHFPKSQSQSNTVLLQLLQALLK